MAKYRKLLGLVPHRDRDAVRTTAHHQTNRDAKVCRRHFTLEPEGLRLRAYSLKTELLRNMDSSVQLSNLNPWKVSPYVRWQLFFTTSSDSSSKVPSLGINPFIGSFFISSTTPRKQERFKDMTVPIGKKYQVSVLPNLGSGFGADYSTRQNRLTMHILKSLGDLVVLFSSLDCPGCLAASAPSLRRLILVVSLSIATD